MPICASSQVVSNRRTSVLLCAVYCTFTFFRLFNESQCRQSCVHTSSDHSCYDVQAPQSREPGGARPPRTTSKSKPFTVRQTYRFQLPVLFTLKYNHHRPHLRHPRSFALERHSWTRLSLRHHLLDDIPISSPPVYSSPAPPRLSGTATCRFVHTDGADKT